MWVVEVFYFVASEMVTDLMRTSSVGDDFSPNMFWVTGVEAMASKVLKLSSPVNFPKIT